VFLFEDPSGVTFYDPQNLLSTGGDLIQGLQTSAAAYYNIHSPEEPSTGVPEPSIPVLLIGALGAIGLGVRRRPPTTV